MDIIDTLAGKIMNNEKMRNKLFSKLKSIFGGKNYMLIGVPEPDSTEPPFMKTFDRNPLETIKEQYAEIQNLKTALKLYTE
jgi:hypothetical protein